MSTAFRRLLITGAAGFIGSHAARLGREYGYEVHGVDMVGTPVSDLLDVQDHKVSTNVDPFDDLVAAIHPDICIHAAGLASVRGSFDDPAPDFISGPALTFALLNALRRHAPACRMLFLSSAGVYGNPLQLPIGEDAPTAPISPYGFHKLQSEVLCREFVEVYGMKIAIARIFSAYGEGLRRQVLWDICRKSICNGRLLLTGTGRETRDFLHVNDITRGIFRILENAPMVGEAYNLASGETVSVADLARMVVDALDRVMVPQFNGIVPVGDPLHWQADIRKIKTLGFAPAVTLDAGVRSYASWARGQMTTASR